MKYFYYVRYFFFIAINWNPRLAWFTLQHEIRGERNYGINTSRLNNLKNLTLKGNRLDAEIYQGANYFLLEKVFEESRLIGINESIIDFGCGKGRAMVVAAHFGYNKITGIEFAKELSDEASKTITPVQKQFPDKIFKVINANAADYNIEKDANVFFFFNPFNEIVMQQVVRNILASLKRKPREVFTIYLNPVHKDIWLSAGFQEIYNYENRH